MVLSGQLVRMKTEVRSGVAVELPMARLGSWQVAGDEALRGDCCERTLRASELTDLLQVTPTRGNPNPNPNPNPWKPQP